VQQDLKSASDLDGNIEKLYAKCKVSNNNILISGITTCHHDRRGGIYSYGAGKKTIIDGSTGSSMQQYVCIKVQKLVAKKESQLLSKRCHKQE